MKYIIYYLIFTGIFACRSSEKRTIINTDTTFNAVVWREGNQVIRGRMVNDLIKDKTLISYSIDSLKSLLGPPSEIGNYFVTYLVDMKRDTLIDNFMLLCFEIDTNTKLVKNYWLTD